MRFTPSPAGVSCEFAVPSHCQSWAGVVHGGIVALMLDEAVGWAAWYAGSPGVTGRLEVRYRSPLRVGEEVRVHGSVDSVRRSLVKARATIERADGTPLAEATASLLAVPTDVAEGLSTIAPAPAGLDQPHAGRGSDGGG
jgi:acyl-coenzyme A thioesterase PaaI-like protein